MKKRISVTIEEITYDKLAKFVSSTKPSVSQSSIVDHAISEYLEDQKGGKNGSRKEETRSKETS